MLPTRKSVPRSSRQIGPHEDILTIVKRLKLQWYGHVSRSSGLAKTILQGTVKGGRRQGRQKMRKEDNTRDRPGVRQVPEGSGEQGKMEKTGCKVICCAPTILTVKGLMMMMTWFSFFHFSFHFILFFIHIYHSYKHTCKPLNHCSSPPCYDLQILQQRERASHRPQTTRHGEEPRSPCTLHPRHVCPGTQSGGPRST